jgi:hypothetical protein
LAIVAGDAAQVIEFEAIEAIKHPVFGAFVLDNQGDHQVHHALLSGNHLYGPHQMAPQPLSLHLYTTHLISEMRIYKRQ